MRLADLVPTAVADQACEAVRDHVTQLCWALYGVGSGPALPEVGPLSDVHQAIERLTAYAQHGTPLDAGVREYLLTIGPAMYGSAHDRSRGTWGDGDTAEEAEPDSPWGLVIVAAVARDRITRRPAQPITTRELAALGSLSHARIRQLLEAGEVVADGRWEEDDLVSRPYDFRRTGREHLVSAPEARRWLAARGVAGV